MNNVPSNRQSPFLPAYHGFKVTDICYLDCLATQRGFLYLSVISTLFSYTKMYKNNYRVFPALEVLINSTCFFKQAAPMCHHIGCLGLLVCHCSFHLPALRYRNIIFRGYEKRKDKVGGDS